MEENLSERQRLLLKIRDEMCGGNSAELGRRIKKDPTYINRLFYPVGKNGAKGIGLEIMDACTVAFQLPPGYWDGVLPAQSAEREGSVDVTLSGVNYAQLLRDLDVLAPSLRNKYIDQIHQAAELARETIANDRQRSGEFETVAVSGSAHARKGSPPKATAYVTYGDGNSHQGALPLSIVADPFAAQPDEREERLYENFKKTPRL
jgi:hypothetical protein